MNVAECSDLQLPATGVMSGLFGMAPERYKSPFGYAFCQLQYGHCLIIKKLGTVLFAGVLLQ